MPVTYATIYNLLTLFARGICNEAEAGMAHSIWRLATGWTAGVQFSAGDSVQTGPGAHLAEYPMESGGSFPEDKAADS
jgi:hypothetical protein